MGTSVLTQILWWCSYFHNAAESSDPSYSYDSLRLHVARSARKEGNFGLAHRELAKYLASERGLGISSATDFHDIVEEIVVKGAAAQVLWSKDNMRAFRETSKLLYDMERSEEALKVCSVTALGISRSIVASGEQAPAELREVGTRVLLTLGRFI